MSNTLKKITTRAKQIYAKGGTWKGAIKKAGAEYRGSGKRKKKDLQDPNINQPGAGKLRRYGLQRLQDPDQ